MDAMARLWRVVSKARDMAQEEEDAMRDFQITALLEEARDLLMRKMRRRARRARRKS